MGVSPYIMITVDSLSGGKSSSMMGALSDADIRIFSVVCIDCPEHKTDPALIKYTQDKFERFCPIFPDFQATAEDDATLIAMIELEQYLGKEIVWVRGELFDDVLTKKTYFGGTPSRLPSWARRYCTTQMKLLPIFDYLYFNGITPCHMNIGFRADEPNRKKNFYFTKDGLPKNAHHFHYPLSCNNFGEHQMNWSDVYYRRAHFPLEKMGVTREMVNDFVRDVLKIEFPEISNCEYCFHKNIETIAFKCHTGSPAKMRWWQSKERIGKGTWRDDKITYETISKSKIGRQLRLSEVSECESEGCGV